MPLAVFGILKFSIQILSIVFESNFDSNTIDWNQLLIETIWKSTVFRIVSINNQL